MNIEISKSATRQKRELILESNADVMRKGCARLSKFEHIQANVLPHDMKNFISAFEEMLLHPHGKTEARHRLYRRAKYFLWGSSTYLIPQTNDELQNQICHYFQRRFKSERCGEVWSSSEIPDKIVHSTVMPEIMNHVTLLTHFSDFDRCRPCLVGIHFTLQQVDGTYPEAPVSPNCMHQEGEMLDFLIIVGRKNFGGSIIYIGEANLANEKISSVPTGKLQEKFVLERPFDGFCVEDVRVSHGVAPVQLTSGTASGYRRKMHVDVTPLPEDMHA